MYNAAQKAMNSLLERAKLQKTSHVDSSLFNPHILKVGDERTTANHENYSRW